MWILLSLLVACSDYGLSNPDGTKDPEETGLLHQEDTFLVPPPPGLDVLIFGDTSGSMAPELVLLGSYITDLVGGISAYTTDWHLMAVTGPSGCGVNGWFSPEDPDYAAQFAAAILTPPGEDLVDEWGLNNTTAAVENTDPGECNEGFLREEAPLQVIFISDEPDSSPGWDTDPAGYWYTYVDPVQARKGTAGVVYSAVIGPVPDGCEGALPGTGYSDAVAATGGDILSICDPWWENLGFLAQSPVRESTFVLTRLPDPASLQVYVNDLRRPDGWSYDPAQNAIVFSVDLPLSGDTVLVRYAVEG